MARCAAVLLVATELVLIIWVVYSFQLGSRGLLRLLVVVVAGFLVHSALPRRWRLGFFVLLSVVGLALVLGPASAAWIVALGCAVVALCHLPLRFGWRAALLATLAAGLTAIRLAAVPVPWSTAIWPILGSMFLFRTILYLVDQEASDQPRSALWAAAYFFMIPNVCFPLFPIIDFERFRGNWYRSGATVIYQRGIRWMLRGVGHLIAYRIVYHFLIVDPADIRGPVSMLLHVVSTFALFLRVSGIFHIVIGLLHLFGFDLPRPHDRYFLASSLLDFWRRVNLYFRDFMNKVVFLPAWMRWRRRGSRRGIVMASGLVFAVSWALHSYQWFWIRGSFLFEWNDVLFWLIFAMLVTPQIVDFKAAAKRRQRPGGAWGALAHACRIFGTFGTVAILWSMWADESLERWLELWSGAGSAWAWAVAWMTLPFLAAHWLESRAKGRRERRRPRSSAMWSSTPVTVSLLVALALIGTPRVYSELPHAIYLQTVQGSDPNERDRAQQLRGYYEEVAQPSRFNPELAKAYDGLPPDWKKLRQTEGWQVRDDALLGGLVPNISFIFKGARLTTNRWGMRDREYPKAKPPGTWRIALLGSSQVMGAGVPDGTNFDPLAEALLNELRAAGAPENYEILNFGVAGSSVTQHLLMLEDQVLAFDPDAVLVIGYRRDEQVLVQYVWRFIKAGVESPYPVLSEVVAAAEVEADDTDFRIQHRIRPYLSKLQSWTYRRIAQLCSEHDIEVGWVLLPQVDERLQESDVADRIDNPRKAGLPILTLLDVYDGHDPAALQIAPWDEHPNQLAHQLIAERLVLELGRNPRILGIPPPETTVGEALPER